MLRHNGKRFKPAAALLLAVSLLSGCSLLPSQKKELQPPLVKPAEEQIDAVEAKLGTIERFYTGTATVASSKVVPLFYKDNGRLKDIYVDQDDEVKAGQLLAELDMGDLDLQINLQKLNVERASIQFQQVKKSGADDSAVRLSQIDLEREQISLDSLKQKAEIARLVAPSDGIVSFKDTIGPGDPVTGYKPLLGIADPHQLQLVVEADNPDDISSIQLHMAVDVTIGDKEMKGIVVQSPSSAPFTDNKEQAERNSKLLYIKIDKPESELKMGAQANVRISLEKHDNVIVLPRSGLRTYLGRTYVQVLDGERRKEVDVQPGIMTATEVEIVKGLDPGQQIILNN